jgi:hypothetical protein
MLMPVVLLLMRPMAGVVAVTTVGVLWSTGMWTVTRTL